jgi:predicted RNase H-like nuclease (RuvC/YqgF family)
MKEEMEEQMQQKENELEMAKCRIEELEEMNTEKQRKIDELEKKLSQTFETIQQNGRKENGEDFDGLRAEIEKLEQKLMNANEEKEYYKKHFKGEQRGEHGRNSVIGKNNNIKMFSAKWSRRRRRIFY